MSAEAELQKLLVDTIKGNAGVMAIAGGCYDRPPKDPFKGKSAYVTLGSFEQLEDDSDCISGFEFTQTLNVWSKAVGGVECKNLASLLRRPAPGGPVAYYRRPGAAYRRACRDG